MTYSERDYYLACSLLRSATPIRVNEWVEAFGDLANFWQADFSGLIAGGIDEDLARLIVAERQEVNIEAELERLKSNGVSYITLIDNSYPQLLKQIHRAPVVLFYRGQMEILSSLCVAVVGSRKMTPYGRDVTEQLVSGIASQQVCIVSGMAYGIDSIAHQATLSVGGATVAVLGNGLDWASLYPASNRNLAEKILANGGLILSEYPIGFRPTAYSFPSRNRIIAGGQYFFR